MKLKKIKDNIFNIKLKIIENNISLILSDDKELKIENKKLKRELKIELLRKVSII